MGCMQVTSIPWEDFGGGKTEALCIDVDRLYTVSEFISLLEEAKRRWGDKPVTIHDMNSDTVGGFSIVYLKHGFDCQDDEICIYG